MTNPKHQIDILRLLDKVFYYSVDSAEATGLELKFLRAISDDSEDLKMLENLGLDSLNIDQNDFHNNLYARSVYSKLLNEIRTRAVTQGPLSVLKAPAGWGKTSALAAAVDGIKGLDIAVIWCDFKRIYDELIADPTMTDLAFKAEIHRIQRSIVKDFILDQEVDDQTYFATLVAGLTQNDIKFENDALLRLRMRNLRNYLNTFSDDISSLPQPASLDMSQPREKRIHQWISFFNTTEKQTNRSFLEIYREAIGSKISVSDQIAALLCSSPTTFALFIYDNIDFLKREFRPICHNYAMGVHNSLRSLAGSIVAIREENYSDIRYSREDSGGAFAEPIVPAKYAAKPDSADLKEKYPHLAEVAEDPAVTPASMHILEYLTRRCNFAWDLLNHSNLHEIGDLKNLLIEMSDTAQIIAKTLLSLDMSNLSNQNMRAIAHYFTEFWIDLYAIEDLGLKTRSGENLHDTQVREIINHPDRVETRFYIWLYVNAEELGIRLPNVVAPGQGIGDGATISDVLSIDHLLLSSIFNASGNRRAPYHEILRRLTTLGFKPNQVHVAFKRIARKNESLLSIIGDLDVSDDNFDNTEVRLSPLGQAMLVNVFPSVGYTMGSLLTGSTYSKKMTNYYSYRSAQDRATAVLDHLTLTATTHLRAMDLVRDRADHSPVMTPSSWLKTYQNWFCVEGQSQIERQLVQAIDFYHNSHNTTASFFRSSLEQYRRCRDDLGNGIEFAQLDLRSLAINSP